MSLQQPAPVHSVAIIGCGWLGIPLARALINQGIDVVATRSNSANCSLLQNQGINAIRLVLNPEVECSQLEALSKSSIAIILLPPGIRKGSGHEFPEKISNLAAALKMLGLTRMILASSTSIYPSQNCEVDETAVIVPDTESGRILLRAEESLMQRTGIQAIVVRLAGLCGPGREPGRLLAGKKDLAGASNPVNLIHQSDATDLLVRLIHHQPWGQVFNACAPLHPSRSQLYTHAARAMQLYPPEFNTKTSPFKQVDGDKICKQTGFVYHHPNPADWCW